METINSEISNQNPLSSRFTEGIDPDAFYGPKKYLPTFHHQPNGKVILHPKHSARFNRLSGPSLTWMRFKKQDDVIQFISRSNNDLMPFTFQSVHGDRFFLAAHPLIFWHYDEQREMKDRNTYEIIREFQTCKLYFDLEYEISSNPNHDGHRMVNNFIHLVISALKHKYEIEFDSDDVLSLDSSTNSKFSCHLIFQLKNCYFRDNYNVGFFVKQLCHEIRLWIKRKTENENLLLLPRVDLSRQNIEELEVTDTKGNRKLFCDEAVYSKNRHFRLYKSSKYGKIAPLLESRFNKFVPIAQNSLNRSETLFLHSLITWITDTEPYRSLEFPPNKLHYSLKIRFRTNDGQNETIENYQKSPFPEIDQCITDIVHPGKIYRSVFFKENNTIVYDIVGNRFCMNIGRAHKSNNVKYVVDLHTLTYYQKCHDPDCANFKSSKKGLPINEHFFLNNNIDDDLIATAEDYYQSIIKESTSKDLFSCEISDEQLYEIVKSRDESHQQKDISTVDTFINEAFDVEMASVLDHIEENFSSRRSEDKSESGAFSDEISENDMIALADRCESELNDFKNGSSEADFFSNEVDDSLMVSAAEKCESIYSSPKKER